MVELLKMHRIVPHSAGSSASSGSAGGRRAPAKALAERAAGDVENGGEDQAEGGHSDHPEEDRGAERLAKLPARAARDHQRQHAEDEGEAGHQDRAKPGARRLDRRLDRPCAALFGLLGEFDDQDRILRRQRDQHDQADLGQDIIVHPPQVHAGHRRQQRHRHDQDDRQRQQQAFELGRQHEEDEHHRQSEDQDGDVARRFLLEGDTGPFGREARRKARCQLLHRAHRLSGRRARARSRRPPRPRGRGCSG